jgi:succinyl-CoA synthetase beta subunit
VTIAAWRVRGGAILQTNASGRRLMARLLEDDAKSLLSERALRVPRGAPVSSAEDAEAVARTLAAEVAVKALVAANRRGLAGGVRMAATAAEAKAAAADLLRAEIAGAPVERVLVEERVALGRELFLSVVLDEDRGCPVVLASRHGGVSVEETFSDPARAPAALELDPLRPTLPHRYRELWRTAGAAGAEITVLASATARVVETFFELDATALELNPLAIVDDEAVAVGALIAVDDAALARHPGLRAVPDGLGRPPTALERRAAAVAAEDPYRGTARFIELDGDIGLLVGGGGGSLVFFDAVRRAGGRPACYTEIGGNPSAEKVRGLANVVLDCPRIRALLVGHNITNNTQVDLVAAGVVAALADRGLDTAVFPVVAREVGTNDDEGRRIFEAAGVEYCGEDVTMDAAARRIVERAA